MSFCNNCGEKLPDDAKFCNNCGAPTNHNSNTQRKTVYDGEIHKCPNCGEQLTAFLITCPACGYEIRGSKGISVVNVFAKELEAAASIEQKIDLIRNFHIPNTKEDIYEFFILAVSNLNSDCDVIEAWYAKMEQAYQKASLTFGSLPEFQNLTQMYKEAKKKYAVKSSIRGVKKSKLLQSILLSALGAVLIIIGFFAGSASGDSDSPFYMLAMVGILPFLGGVGLFTSSKNKDNNQNKKNKQ